MEHKRKMKQKFKTICSMSAMCAAIVFATSCAKEELSQEAQSTIPGVERTINAGVHLPASSSTDKAFLDIITRKVYWEIGDGININGTTLTANDVDNSLSNPEARFQGTVHALNTTSGRDVYWAVYPASLAGTYTTGIPTANFSANGFTYNFPAIQNLGSYVMQGNTYGDGQKLWRWMDNHPLNVMQGNTYMAAYADVAAGQTNLRFDMRNLGSILHLVLSPATGTSNARVSRIEFTTTDGALSGDFTLGTDTATITPSASAARILTVNLSDGTNSYVDISGGADVYVMMPPMSGKQLTMKVYNDADHYTKKTASSINMDRNKIYTTAVSGIAFDEYIYYSVSATKKVLFSPGNLQWSSTNGGSSATTHAVAGGGTVGVAGTWRFAEHQWDYVGDATNGNVSANGVKCNNANVSSTYQGWIDLFGWGTSGYNNKYPSMTSTTATDYGDGNNDIAGTNYDWGVYNEIYNPKTNTTDAPGTWYTLTSAEWDYLIFTRSTSSGIRYAKATVHNVQGLIIVPDNWISSTYTLNSPNTSSAAFNSNNISAPDWTDIFEPAGCTFLPAAGWREGTSLEGVNSRGRYWSAAYYDSGSARRLYFDSGSVGTDTYGNRKHGRSVRLVKDAN